MKIRFEDENIKLEYELLPEEWREIVYDRETGKSKSLPKALRDMVTSIEKIVREREND